MPVDDFRVPWANFADFCYSREDLTASFLTELNHDQGNRTEWTIGQWRNRVAATAAWLESTGIRPGDCVATLAGNTADALALAYGCWVAGACCMPLNPQDPVDRQSFTLRDASAVLLVYSPQAQESVDELVEATAVPTVQVDRLPLREQPDPADPASLPPGLGKNTTVDLRAAALRVYTSGTTGSPKAVVLTVENLLTDCDALMRGLEWGRGTRILTVLPVHHVNGLIISSLLPWYAGFSTVLCDRFRSASFWDDVASEQATVCSIVPSLLEFLAEAGKPTIPGFHEFLCGAGPLLVDTVLDFEQRFGVPVRHLYGLSETTAVATLMPRLTDADRQYWHGAFGFPSIGPELPHTHVSVVDGNGHPCEAGNRGEIVVRGRTVMEGYAGSPLATDEAFRQGWFHSGDEGFWQEGPEATPYYFITGRIKELIIRGGVNISPFEVDEVLRSHPCVRYGLAIPFDNRYYGEEIAGYVVLDAPADAEEILVHCAARLDHARCPKVVLFGEGIPYTATGKAKRLALKEELAPVLAEYRDVQFRRSADSDV